jgi:WD40 repeat protein
LQHPNIVQIYETHQQDGLPYFALEYVEGGSVSKKLQGTPMAPREAAKLVETVARAIHAAHEKGIVHRDLKPANILLTRDGQPKITDFGLAKRLEVSVGLTHTGEVLGTPSYMAPEQADNSVGPVGPPADIYAIGAVLYELLTGRPPFRALSHVATLRQVMEEEPISPRRLQPGVLRDLETICMKALAKEPARRYATANDLADDLRRCLDQEPILARPAGKVERFWRWCKRRPALAASLAASLLTVVTAFVLILMAWDGTRKAALAEKEAHHRALVSLAVNQLDRGLSLCEQGNPSAGLLWMARSLKHLPENSPDLEYTIRANLGAWQARVASLSAILTHPVSPSVGTQSRGGTTTDVGALAFCPKQDMLVTAGWDGRIGLALLWDMNGRQVGNPIQTPNPILSVAFHPNGKLLATGGQDACVRLWDVSTLQSIRSFETPGPVLALAFDPTGRALLVGGRKREFGYTDARDPNEGYAELRDANDGNRLKSFAQKGPVRAVAISPDGRLAAIGRTDRIAQIVAIETGHILPLLHSDIVHAVAFSPDSKWVVTGCEDCAAYVWNATQGTPRDRRPLWHQDAVRSVAYSPDGQLILTGSRDQTARLWNAESHHAEGTPFPNKGVVGCVAFSPTGKVVATGGSQLSARLWDVHNIRQSGQQFDPVARVEGAKFSRSGKRVAVLGEDRNLILWDTVNAKPIGDDVMSPGGDLIGLGFGVDEATVLTAADSGQIKTWDAETGKPIHTWSQPGLALKAAFSPDGNVAAIAMNDGPVRLVDVVTGKLVGQPLTHNAPVHAVAFSSDGRHLATGDHTGFLRIWRLSDQAMMRSHAHSHPIEAVTFFNDGSGTVAGCADGSVHVWSSDGRRERKLHLHQKPIRSIDSSADRRWLLTAYGDESACIWNLTSGTLHQEFNGVAVALGADGRQILAGGQEKVARFRAIATDRPIGPLMVHRSAIRTVAFSSDGKTGLTACRQPLVHLFDLSTPAAESADTLERRLKVLLGAELDERGNLTVLSADDWQRLRAETSP